jgi:UDP-2,3-diacylglucosamine hydrolase
MNSLPSKFLPPNYNPSKPLVVIAGKGNYPALTIEKIRQHNIPVCLIAFYGETRSDIINSFPSEKKAIIKVGQMGKMLKQIEKFKAAYTIMVGQITPKRLFKGLSPDLQMLKILTRLKEKNAETIFGAICTQIEKLDVTTLDARNFLDDQLAHTGMMTRGKLKIPSHYIEHGIHIAKQVAQLNIGQSVIVRKGTVIAVEAFEGTDAMLHRASLFKTDQLIFVKTAKSNQDYRFDVPCFGMKTLQIIKEAKIQLACLQANTTILLQKQTVLQQANQWGIQIYGYTDKKIRESC